MTDDNILTKGWKDLTQTIAIKIIATAMIGLSVAVVTGLYNFQVSTEVRLTNIESILAQQSIILNRLDKTNIELAVHKQKISANTKGLDMCQDKHMAGSVHN